MENEEVDESQTGQTSEEEEFSEESQTGQTDEKKITQEDLTRLGLSKTFLGKPYYETLENSYGESVKWNTKLAMNLKELEKKFDEFNVKLTKTEVKEVKETVEDQMPEMPDPLDNPKAFNKWLKERDELTKKELRKEFEDKLKQQPNPELNKLIYDHNSQILSDSLEEGLKEAYGDDYEPGDIEAVGKEYEDYLANLPEAKRTKIINLYSGDPEGLAEAILTYHKAKNFGKKIEQIDEKDKEKHDKKVKKLINTKKNFTQTASSPRTKYEEKNETSPYKKLISEMEVRLAGEE